MPFRKVNIEEEIERLRNSDPEFREVWDSSRMEFEILAQLTKLRNQKGWSQEELAKRMGAKQQVISRIEKKEQSPTLKTICNMANVLGVDITFTPRPQ